jgi:hypothetical protein
LDLNSKDSRSYNQSDIEINKVFEGALQDVHTMISGIERPGESVIGDWTPEHTGLMLQSADSSLGVQGGSQWVKKEHADLVKHGGDLIVSTSANAFSTGGFNEVKLFVTKCHELLANDQTGSNLRSFLQTNPY